MRNKEAIQAWLIERIADEMSIAPSEVDPHAAFDDLGMASRDAVSLSGDIEYWLGRKLSPTVLWQYPSIAQLSAHLAGDAAADTAPAHEPAGDGPVAVIGIGIRVPGASSVSGFWTLLSDARDEIRDVPPDRWDSGSYYDPTPGTPGKMYTRQGGFLDRVDLFDADFFGIPPREAARMDPQQRLLMETVWEALEDAGVPPTSLAGSQTGVFIGIATSDYSAIQMGDAVRVDAYAGTGNSHSLAPNRISYFLDLRGPSIAIDTACSSSLVAIHQAIASLRSGECTLALVGGVNVILSPEMNMIFSHARMMAPDGRCKTFDASADGYVRGEGCAVVVLKPLAQAVADGDTIHAVIRGSAVNHDGRSNGITAPNGLAQQDVVRRALADAGVAPREVGYIEAHGTGTSLGDPIEVDALKAVLLPDRAPDESCVLGSVKTNIGHLEAAAGVVGLIKAALVLERGAIPAHLHLTRINPLIELDGTPMRIATQHERWPRADGVRIAGVSSFGFGGANAHVVLEQAPVRETAQASGADRPLHVLAFSARTDNALKALASRYAGAVESLPLADVCYAANTGRTHLDKRVSIAAADSSAAIAALREFADTGASKTAVAGSVKPGEAPKLAFLFTGQGAQFPNMGRALYETSPVFRRVLDECDEVLRPCLDEPLLRVLYPSEGASTPLDETRYTQPALFAIEYALAELWKSWGVVPSIAMGHSVGEYVAACVAGVFSFDDGLNLIAERARLMGALPSCGGMAAVLTDRATVASVLDARGGSVAIAGVNGPANTVISGPLSEIDAAVAEFKVRGVKSIKLNVSHAFHSPLMDPMLDEFERFASRIAFRAPDIPVVSNLYGRVPDGAHAFNAAYWRRHLREAVQFFDGIRAIAELGFTTFIEAGPQATLSGMGARCLPKDAAVWLPSLAKGQDDWQTIVRSVQSLYAAGAHVDWRGFDRPYTRARVSAPTYPFARERHWLDTVGARPSPVAEKAELPSPPNGMRDWLYHVRWTHKDAAHDAAPAPQRWIVFADAGGVGDTLAAKVRARGGAAVLVRAGASYTMHSVDDVTINASDRADFERLWSEHGTACDRVVHLWSLDAPEVDGATLDSLHRAHALGCGAVIHLIQAISASTSAAPRRLLWCVTRGAQCVGPPNGGAAVAQAPLWGFGRSAALEYGPLWGGLIDLDSHDAAIDALFLELDAPDPEDQIAFRSGQRFVARLSRDGDALASANGHAVRCHADATYLVTGGLGGLGLHVARWLGQRGAKHVVLFGRTPLPPRIEWTAVRDTAIRERIDTVRALEAAGVEVQCAAVDVTDEAQMAAFLDDHDTKGRPPVRGVVHAAGVIDDFAVIGRLDMQSFSSVMRPKVDGAFLLHRRFDANGNGAPNRLDFFVLFSSVASVMGAAGQAGYAAGNAFMDALAHYRRAHGQPAISINWGPWAEAGMAARSHLAERMEAQGIAGIKPDEGIAVLDRIVSSGASHVGVLHADWARVAETAPAFAESPLYSELVNGHAKAPAARPAPRSASSSNDVEAIEAYLRRQVAIVIGRPEDEVAIDRNFGELGIDSIMMMEIVHGIERDLGVRLFPKEMFERPAIAQLAPYLVDEIARTAHGSDVPAAGTGAISTPARVRPRLRRIGPAVRNTPAVFLLSAPRSGSTLLRVMLAGHPGLFSPPELHLLPYNTMREWRDGLESSYLGEGLARAWMELCGCSAEEAKAIVDAYVESDAPIERVYADLQKAAAPRLLADKSPSYGEAIDILEHAERAFDGAKYVHLVRHPYSVIESFVRNRIDRLVAGANADADAMAVGEDVWASHNANIADFLSSVDPRRRCVIKYEDLVADPEGTMKSLCTFLEISFDASVLRPYEGDRMTDGVHKTSAPIGDPNFKNHDSIDASLGDVWRRTRLPRKLAGFARRVAAEFDYPLPVEVPGSGNMDVGLSADVPHVVAIQPKGTRPPFFCCAPGGGVSFMYFHLPEFMGEDQPIYALQDPALNPLIDPFTTVESLSAVQVKAIRKIQPKGPYHLGGWSFGGTVAFEMAQQLRAVGEEVAFFAAIDTEAPIDKHKRRTWRERLKGAWDQAKMSLKVLKSMPPYVRDIFYMYFSTLTKSNKGEGATASLWEHVTFAWADMIRHTLVKRADIAQVASRDSRVLLVAQPQTRRVFRVLRANIQSLKLYKPKPYDGPITLLRAEDQFLVHQLHDDWTLGWRELARGRVDVVEVPGNHAVLLTHPFVQTTGRALREGMDKAIKEFGGRAVEEDDASAPA